MTEAFARGTCIGYSTPAQCRDCLAAAVMDVSEGCGADTRRAGAWLNGCYLSYADTNATSPRERAFHRWFFDGDILPFRDNLDPTFLDMTNGAVAALAANRSRSGRMLAATQEFDDSANTGLSGRVLAQCAAGRAPADCVQCLQDSARAMMSCCWDARGLRESVAAVLGYDCVLQFTMHLASSAPSLASR
uniref:Gnk2-homologous domain-containing protein n=1 Tax=Oryza punctata TaxID=4537 RepID=A0A0E0JPE7_ORYPU